MRSEFSVVCLYVVQGSDKILDSESMSIQDNMPLLLNLRTILIIAALICLCVSSNVGPQFLPLPIATSQMALDIQLHQAKSALYPPQADPKGFRVPMMVQSKKRADKEPPQSDQLIVLPTIRLVHPRETRFAIEIDYPICFLASVKMTPHAGRAPPSSVV